VDGGVGSGGVGGSAARVASAVPPVEPMSPASPNRDGFSSGGRLGSRGGGGGGSGGGFTREVLVPSSPASEATRLADGGLLLGFFQSVRPCFFSLPPYQSFVVPSF
jgi:hypothetical protein